MKAPLPIKPPALAGKLVSRFIDRRMQEEFLGDLYEIYQQRFTERGRLYSSLLYWIDSFHLIFAFSTFKIFKFKTNNVMFRSMFTIAWRTALRAKQFTLLNILGLTIGIATSIIIGLYAYDEMTYDTFHLKGDRIYRVNQPLIWGNWDEQFASTGPNVAIALREDAPEFEEVTRIQSLGEQTLNVPVPGKEFNPMSEKQFFAADANFFDVFTFQFLHGDAARALREPMSMVITSETADRYFGKQDVIGKTVDVKQPDGSWGTYTVTAVLTDLPSKSHLQFDILVSISSFNENLKRDDWKWIFTAFATYGLVKEGTDITALTNKIQAVPPKWAALTTERIFNQTFAEFTAGKPWKLYLQPLRNIYLSDAPSHHRFGPTGNPQFVKIFGAIGIVVIVLCSINFMNLSTARSANRSKEVGIRKVMGSQKITLIKQFIFESILFVTVSTLLAVLVAQLCISAFNTIAEKQLALLPYLRDPYFIGIVILFVFSLGGLAGSYPAFYLSSFQPVETLKGKLVGAAFKGKNLRNGLVIFQFTLSIALIICTAFVQKQLAYTSAFDMGFAEDNVLQLHKVEQLGTASQILKNKLAANPSIKVVAKSFGIPPNVWEGERYKAFGPHNPIVDLNNIRVDEDYLGLLGVQFLAGRNFDRERINDKHTIILNEEAVKTLGWGTRDTYATESPIGKFVVPSFDEEKKLEVIGVVKNFNFHSVRQKIEPLMILNLDNDWFWNHGAGPSFLSMRLNPETVRNAGDLRAVIESVKKEVNAMDGSVPFEYSFMNEDFEATFRTESRMAMVLNIFAGMALIIACLGLFGLAAFAAEQRIKELGIRRVMGANISELMLMFSGEFTRLILISIVLASSLAYFLMNEWLDQFAYRTNLSIWVFVVSTFGALVIAVLTISYQSFSAAQTNPAETLRNKS